MGARAAKRAEAENVAREVAAARLPAVRVAIDLNVRIGAHLTYSGFEDITGASPHSLPRGTPVEVYEAESGLHGPATVAGRDFGRELIYLHVEWSALGDCQHGCNGDCVESGSDRCDFTCHPGAGQQGRPSAP